VSNGNVCVIPDAQSLPSRLRLLPAPYTSCRIFRWAACMFNTPHS
jgi:hypothetical protein